LNYFIRRYIVVLGRIVSNRKIAKLIIYCGIINGTLIIMLRQRINNIYTLIFILFTLILLWLFHSFPCNADPIIGQIYERQDPEKELRMKKLELEIQELKKKNDNYSHLASDISTYTSGITTFVAVIGLIFTALKQITDRRVEQQRGFDEKFSKIVEFLDSENHTDAGAVLLMNFLKPEYKDMNSQIIILLLSHLRKDHTEDVRRLLIIGFLKSLKIELSNKNKSLIDFSRTHLAGIDLSGFNLFRAVGVDFDMEKANLTGAKLEEVRFQNVNLRKATLHNACLVSAKIKNSKLEGARFQGASLQGIHFENSKLEGAQFQGANLCDAYFYGASLDIAAINTIARNVEKLRKNIHFDKEIEEKITQLKKEAETRGNRDTRND